MVIVRADVDDDAVHLQDHCKEPDDGDEETFAFWFWWFWL